VKLDAGFSITGWLAGLLTLVLSSVFAEGTLVRDNLEGTVAIAVKLDDILRFEGEHEQRERPPAARTRSAS